MRITPEITEEMTPFQIRYRQDSAFREECLSRQKEEYRLHPEKFLSRSKSWREEHKEQDKANKDACKLKNAAKVSHSNWVSALMKNYGMSEEDYLSFLEKQGGVCAICGRFPSEVKIQAPHNRLDVDHDHRTGRWRGLLCRECNLLLGKVEPNLRKWLGYLGVEEHEN